jgi:hypothetical protein
MTTKSTILLGGMVGLFVCVGVLVLLWLGILGALQIGHTNLTYILWPSSLILVGGWHTTSLGIFTTVFAVIMNCLLYAGVALLLRWGLRSIAKISSALPTA